VRLLVERDDLHMAQDSMLVDIEDLTRYCSGKSQVNLRYISGKSQVNGDDKLI
jgi:hypothetical protein